jgi:hypothetical protein
MLSEVKVSSCIDGLVRLGILERQGERGGDELLGLKAMPKGVIGRVAGGEFGEPPEGVELLPWFSCILLKIHLEEKDVTVSKEEFTAMAAVIAGFMLEGAVKRGLSAGYGRPVLSHPRSRRSPRKGRM